jgi:hypothetical protein
MCRYVNVLAPCGPFNDGRTALEDKKYVHMNVLTAEEQTQLEVIAQNASREGWIGPSATLVAERSTCGSSVTITAHFDATTVQRSYPRDERWPFQLLRDLAWGLFRTG